MAAITLIGIGGGSGSGKTTLTLQLQQFLGVERISMDDFYRDRSHLPPARRARLNVDHPRALDWPAFEAALAAIVHGRTVQLPSYDFGTHTRLGATRRFAPSPIVLVEGLWLFRKESIRQLFALRCFVDCPERTRLRRRLARDHAERGRTRAEATRQFCETVAPMHERYVAPQLRSADIVVHFPITPAAVQRLAADIRSIAPLVAFAP